MTISQVEIDRRISAVAGAHVHSQIGEQFVHPDDAADLDKWARCEIDGNEVRRRILARVYEIANQRKAAA